MLQTEEAALLRALVNEPLQDDGWAWMTGERVALLTGLSPGEINEKVRYLESRGLAQTLQRPLGIKYYFGLVSITARGRLTA